MNKKIAVSAVAACLAPLAQAQALKVDHYTPSQVLSKAQELEPQAQKEGSASTKLEQYPNHHTMVALRHKDGGAELHENFADFFYVVKGKATLVTGGAIADEQTSAPGEIKGSAVTGGERTALGEGDVVHIPAGLSHQLLVGKGDTFVYFVIKVKEK